MFIFKTNGNSDFKCFVMLDFFQECLKVVAALLQPAKPTALILQILFCFFPCPLRPDLFFRWLHKFGIQSYFVLTYGTSNNCVPASIWILLPRCRWENIRSLKESCKRIQILNCSYFITKFCSYFSAKY